MQNIELETKIELVEIDENCIILFVYIPKGYISTSSNIEGFKSYDIGYLKSFNRIKKISHWKKDNLNLVKSFELILEKRGWNFTKYPNPYAYMLLKNIQ